MRELEGKVVIVTGGGKAKSVGYGVARALARHGANLAVTGPSKGKLTAAKELEGEFGIQVLPLKVEHPDEKSTVEALVQVVERLGRVDALANCALVAKNGTPLARVKSSELSTKEYVVYPGTDTVSVLFTLVSRLRVMVIGYSPVFV